MKTKKHPSPPVLKLQAIPMNHKNKVLYWAMKLVLSLVILCLAYLFAKKITTLILRHVNQDVSEHKKLMIRQLSNITFYLVLGFGFLAALVNLGVQTTTILTVFGTLMVTVGFALQSTLSSIFAGIGIAMADNFRIGDNLRVYVPLVKGVVEGEVLDMNISYVILLEKGTRRVLYIPNSTVSTNMVVNLSRTSL